MTSHRRPKQARSRKTYNCLLDAAGDLLGEIGMERISTNLICERAGCTPPAFYRYFDDKYAIVEALAERMGEAQNVELVAWVERNRDTPLAELPCRIPELLRIMHEITQTSPGALWVLRAMRAMPRLTHIRLASHNYVTEVLTDLYMRQLAHVPRDLVRRRTRMSVEIAYSLDEMLKEGEADPDTLFADVTHVFEAMFHYPDYTAHAEPDER